MSRLIHVAAVVVTAGLCLQPRPLAQTGAAPTAPTIDELISLKRAASPAISPDGQWVAYTVREANWDDNNYHTEIWLADAKTGATHQLTSNTKKSSSSPAWAPDGTKLAFATDRDDKRQIYVIDPRGGEARKITSSEEGVGSFAWSPDGKSFAFTATDAKTDADKDREKQYGDFDVYGEGYRMTHLWVHDVAAGKARRLTSGAFTVGGFDWSPDGREIAFAHRVNPANTSGDTEDISVVSVADGRVRDLVTQPGADGGPIWSPDGRTIAFESAMTKTDSYLNHAIAVVPAAGGRVDYISTAFDENPNIVAWTSGGLFFSASQKTDAYLFRIDPATKDGSPLRAAGQVHRIGLQPDARRAERWRMPPPMPPRWRRSSCHRLPIRSNRRSSPT